MVEQEFHEMFLESVRPSGEEEWYCPTCGRRFLMHWPPGFSKVVLDAGDESAIHSGGKAPGDTGTTQAADALEAQPAEGDDKLLQPFLQWLEKVDFESFWQRDSHQ